ncbi:MAG TPA: LytTR family DNA-binding domain-containing protein [Williamwhitmania sp.]|nr:LytTR family DNA-binding domain-containing protein [Williamwhitmania sp.]
MSKIRCLIVDDEAIARDIFVAFVGRVDELELVGTCANAVEAFNLLSTTAVDLLFLDIQMPQVSGVEFVRNLTNPPMVIFTTAYSHYALEGFDLNAVDYLVKPIAFDRFLKAVGKLFQLAQFANPASTSSSGLADAFIMLKSGGLSVKVCLNNILYIEGQRNTVVLHLQDKEVVSYLTVGEIETMLPGAKFLRIHKSFIISIERVEAYSANVAMVGGKQLPIGRSYKGAVLQILEPLF